VKSFAEIQAFIFEGLPAETLFQHCLLHHEVVRLAISFPMRC